jgi:hypothetical protein
MQKKINKLIQPLLLIASLVLFSYAGDAQTIKGKLTFGGPNVAKGQKVILVPRNPRNEEIVSSMSFYGDNHSQLQAMQAVITYTNNEGYYYFNDVRPGSYILKVCCSRGTVYKFTVPSTYQVLAIRDLSAY